MTLLESVIAFVLLAVVGVACLDLSRGASTLAHSSRAWNRAVATGESALASAAAGAPAEATPSQTVRVARTRWSDDVDVIAVDVAVGDGRTFRLSRLVARASAAPAASAVRP